ncbi:unnamed protein product [Protopolystoma xenopodis]|uniref:Uncharacterized protein n=1 Tax=Protopolystoma xenopodis TaxID=117903 RepID=A0A3S5CQN3_9PLAT|nr:unnamed protein product [Protopolystoma xenopodis]
MVSCFVLVHICTLCRNYRLRLISQCTPTAHNLICSVERRLLKVRAQMPIFKARYPNGYDPTRMEGVEWIEGAPRRMCSSTAHTSSLSFPLLHFAHFSSPPLSNPISTLE